MRYKRTGLFNSENDQVGARLAPNDRVQSLQLHFDGRAQPGRMAEDRKRSVDKKCESVSMPEPAAALKATKQMHKQDSFPYLHHFTERLAVCPEIMKPLMNAKSVSRVNWPTMRA